MNGPIEVSGEANPLTTQTLFRVLTSASSTHQQQVKTGAQQLQNWEKQPGFYSSLQSIFIDTSLPVEVRYLSAIQIKIGIDKYWRKTAQNAISKEEKTLIRSRCLESGVNEPDHRLALQNAIVVAKIIRFEYPQDWSDAISSIINDLRLASQTPRTPFHLSRILLILLYTIKELTTGRLQRTRASLQSATPEILQVLGAIYVDRFHIWRTFLREGGDDEGSALESVEQSLLALRVLRRLLIAGYDFPNRHSEMQEFWKILTTQLGDMLWLVLHQNALHAVVKELIEKHLVQIAKLHLEMVRTHPAGFALLPGSTDLARAYWGLIVQFGQTFGSQTPLSFARIGTGGDSNEDGMSVMEKITLKGLLLLRACTKMVFNPQQTFKYQKAEDKEEKKQSTELMRNVLLTENTVREMMETLVTRFFVFRPRDLRDWEEEPGEWERREEGEGDVWEFSIRSCSEKLFLDLMINYKDLLVPSLLQVFQNVATLQNTEILHKDSIYSAIGLAAPVLEQKLDFQRFLASTLVSEVQVHQPGYNILRRRVAIILGQWLPVKEGLDRPLVYQIFQHLLDKSDHLNDQVVRVTAGRQLKNIVDPFEFAAEAFMPYAPNILGRMMELTEEVELPETKMALLNTISVIVLKMEQNISPFADQIISLLPPLWDQAEEEYLMKQTILSILTGLVTSMRQDSRCYHKLILPLVQSSINPSSETRVYLLEDALDLWSTILTQTPTPASPQIISLADNIFPMFDVASETLRKALEITESYILLIPAEILASAPRLVAPLSALLGNLKREANGTITHLIELLIREAAILGGVDAVTQLTTCFLETHFLTTILTALQDAYVAHQTTGPNRTTPSIDGIVETDYLSVLARLALTSPTLFINAITATARNLGENFETTIAWLLTEWFSHFDNIGSPDKKKLHCLALTALLETNSPWILSRLQDLMTVWTDVITDLIDESTGQDSLIYWDENALKSEADSAEDDRRRKLEFADPTRRLDVKGFVKEKVEAAVVGVGGREVFEGWVGNVDKDILAAFGSLSVF